MNKLIIAVLAIGLLSFTGCGGGGDDPPRPITFGTPTEPETWNPGSDTDSREIVTTLVEQVYPHVFRERPDLTVELDTDLMVKAEVVSNAPQIVEYVIRDEATWSDGIPITGDDFEMMWQFLRGERSDVEVSSTEGYEDISSVESTADGKTVTVTFAEPYADWPRLFSDILPAHIVNSAEEWNTGLDGSLLPRFSGGPFMLDGYVEGQQVSLKRNEAYWGEPPGVSEILVRFGVAPAAVPERLGDDVDVAAPAPQVDLMEAVDQLDGVDHAVGPGLRYESLVLDLSHHQLADASLRTAIAMAIDGAALVDATVGLIDPDAEPLGNRIWMPAQDFYADNRGDLTRGRTDDAAALLQEAGYERAGDGTLTRDGSPVRLRMTTTGGNPLREAAQDLLVTQLAEIGVQVREDNANGSAAFIKFFPDSNRLADQDFDTALFAWLGSLFPTRHESLYRGHRRLVGSNPAGFDNDEVEALFERAEATLDPAEAAAIYNQIDEILWRELPSIPLFVTPAFVAWTGRVEGPSPNASGSGPLWNAHEWRLADG